MKKSEPYDDRGLRLALKRKNEAAAQMKPSDDFTDRLMQRVSQKDEQPKRRRVWLYSAIGAIAASGLLLLTLHRHETPLEPQEKPVVAQQIEPITIPETPVATQTEKPLKRKTAKKHKPVLQKTEPAETPPQETQENTYEKRLPDTPDIYLRAVAQARDIRARGERLHRDVAQLIQELEQH